MTVLAGLHRSHCACLQRSFSICRGYSMSLGPWPTKLPMTWDSDIGVDHFDVPIVWNSSGITLHNPKKEDSGLGGPFWRSEDMWGSGH